MENIPIAHRETRSWSDKIALNAVRFLRFAMDIATGYRHPEENNVEGAKPAAKSVMTESKWFVRFIFLESVARVPGMVGKILRHLYSLRKIRRDNR